MLSQEWIAIIALGFGVITSSSAGLVWAIRQEGRINGHDKLFEEREKLADWREENAQKRHDELLARFNTLEDKL